MLPDHLAGSHAFHPKPRDAVGADLDVEPLAQTRAAQPAAVEYLGGEWHDASAIGDDSPGSGLVVKAVDGRLGAVTHVSMIALTYP